MRFFRRFAKIWVLTAVRMDVDPPVRPIACARRRGGVQWSVCQVSRFELRSSATDVQLGEIARTGLFESCSRRLLTSERDSVLKMRSRRYTRPCPSSVFAENLSGQVSLHLERSGCDVLCAAFVFGVASLPLLGRSVHCFGIRRVARRGTTNLPFLHLQACHTSTLSRPAHITHIRTAAGTSTFSTPWQRTSRMNTNRTRQGASFTSSCRAYFSSNSLVLAASASSLPRIVFCICMITSRCRSTWRTFSVFWRFMVSSSSRRPCISSRRSSRIWRPSSRSSLRIASACLHLLRHTRHASLVSSRRPQASNLRRRQPRGRVRERARLSVRLTYRLIVCTCFATAAFDLSAS